MEKIINSISHANKELEEHFFFVLAWTAITANTIGYLSNALLYGWTKETIFNFICALIMYFAGILGMSFHKQRIAAPIILIVCNLIEFPAMYLMNGASQISYMILGTVATALFLHKKWRITGVSLLTLFDAAVILFRIIDPLDCLPNPAENPVATLISFAISCICLIVLTISLLQQYERQYNNLQLLAEEFKRRSHLDSLTQLYNRHYLSEYLEAKMNEQEATFAVALLDIDDFKAINDTYGHVYGDKTLQAFAALMKDAMQGHGIAARFGGEEFMLVFDSVERENINRILAQIAAGFDAFGMETKQIHVSFSGGVEVFHQEDKITKLFNAADEKLYYAKHTGKNKIIFEK